MKIGKIAKKFKLRIFIKLKKRFIEKDKYIY